MKKLMKKRVLIAALSLFLMSGCAAGQPETPATSAPAQGSGEAGAVSEPEKGAEPAAPPEPVNFFEAMPSSYILCSGAGAWSTDLTLEPDGAFTGVYHDSEMGLAGEGYLHGTRYYCAFSGKFTQPEQVDSTIWSMKIETIELEHPADESEEIIDEIRYVYTGPFGLENTEELLIYLPDTPVEGLAAEVLWAVRGPYDWQATEDGTLGVYVIYNPAEELGLAQYPL